MGITGANFAVAETGTVVLVTNEGNGRMVTTLPRVHVAVMGMEKVIPSMTDLWCSSPSSRGAPPARSSPSTPRSCAGPRRPGELEGPGGVPPGPARQRPIAQIAGTLREALYCLRCGACLNVCPVYRQIGGHAYGYTYPGPHRHPPHRHAQRHAVGEGPGARLVAVRRVPGRVPGADRHPAHADRAARAGRPREDRAVDGARGVQGARAAAHVRPALFRLSARASRACSRRRSSAGDGSRRCRSSAGSWTATRDLPAVARADLPRAVGGARVP